MSTDLPVPEPPITTTDSPVPTLRSTPRSTFFAPKDLCSPATAIFGCFGASVIGRRRPR